MMEKVKIKTEYNAQRCEICHQSDCFDPETNNCFRCDKVNVLRRKEETTLYTKKPFPYYNYYIENHYTEKQALKNGILNFSLSVLYSTILNLSTHDNKEILILVFLILVLSISGIGNLIDWHYLRNGKELILKKHRNLLSQILMITVTGGCILGQLVIGNIDITLSLIAGVFLVFSLSQYYKLHQKANELEQVSYSYNQKNNL